MFRILAANAFVATKNVQKVPFVQPVRNYKQLVDGISKCTPKRIPPKTVPKPNGAISALKLTGLAAGFLQNVSPPEFLTSAPSITIKIERRDKRKEQIKLFSLCLAGCVVVALLFGVGTYLLPMVIISALFVWIYTEKM